MSYLVNQTKVSSLRIGGQDYTSSLVEWTASDQSAYKNGCLQTTGNLVLGSYAGGPPVEDYDRNIFRRGVVVTLDLTEPGGAPYRHPRGLLYVISTSYDVEAEQLVVELGCRLVLMALTEEISALISIVPVALDVAQTTYQNCSASFASLGQYVYQDNQGALVAGTFFQGDTTSGVATGDWVSILGVTTTTASPLAGVGAVPDQINLSYQVPSGDLNSDQRGRVDTTSTSSYYFTRYPAVSYIRVNSDATTANPNGTLTNILNVNTGTTSSVSRSSSACGNTPPQPVDNGTDGETVDSCTDGYELRQSPLFLPATRTETTITTYGAPGAQVSSSFRQVVGPEIEANPQYFADKYAYCRDTWATACQPNGTCPYDGMGQRVLGNVRTINYYGSANELVRSITDTYATKLSAAQPSDWRSGNVNGIPQDFNGSLTAYATYRAERRDTRYYKDGNTNVQEDTVYTSMASRGVGIGGNLDALQGIKTRTVRRSSTISTVEIAPDRVNTSTTATKEETTTIPLFTGRFKAPPAEVGPYVLEEQIPVPLLFNDPAEIQQAVDSYINYIERFTKGDAFGIQVGESMRAEVVSTWKPGQPFRYSDPSKGKIIAMRMDATSWGVNQNEAAFVTNGIWIGFSNGTLTIPENLVGNSTPDMGGGGQPPVAPIPPAVNDESSVDSGSLAWTVDVHMMLDAEMEAFGRDGIVSVLPSDLTYNTYFTTTCFVAGLITGPGDLLATGPDGSIPLDAAGNLVTVDATIINADLFSQ